MNTHHTTPNITAIIIIMMRIIAITEPATIPPVDDATGSEDRNASMWWLDKMASDVIY